MDAEVGNGDGTTTVEFESETNKRHHSAATIEHTEIHVDVKKSSQGNSNNGPKITTDGVAGPGVRYSGNETGQTTVIVQTKPDPKDKPKDYVVTSCFVIMLCNFCLGIPAWHFGLKANYAWQLGEEVECRRQAKRAKILVFCGVILGIITWVLALVLFFTVSPLRPGA